MELDEIRVAKISNVLHNDIQDQIQSHSSSPEKAKNLSLLLNNINQFQPCPQLLDKHLKQYVETLLKYYIDGNQKWVCEVFYTFGKIVTSKKMLNFMKTDVNLIPIIISKIHQSEQIHWHEQYLLLCWISVLCLAPFKLDALQSDAKDRIFETGLYYLKQSGPLQPLGARVLASLIMRSDCEDMFEKFMTTMVNDFSDANDVIQQGYLLTLNVALQKDFSMKFKTCLDDILRFIKSFENSEKNVDLIIKIYSKIVKYLIDLDAYDQIEDIISYFMENFSNRSTDSRFLISRKFVKLVNLLDSCFRIEIMVDMINSTKELLQESYETINSDKLHTHLLVLAEFLRQALIDKSSYKDIEEILDKTLYFQQSRITFIAGSNIRDASNFICWSLFKYNKDIEIGIAQSVFLKLLFVACFDKEIMIRRSSTAALQELIGRYGSKIWEQYYPDEENSAKNIRLIEILDYVDLGSIEKSYFDIPSKVLLIFPDIRERFINFLSQCIYNVDDDIVKMSAKALRLLLDGQSQNLIDSIITHHITTNQNKKFNTFIALAEILPLSKNGVHLDKLAPKFQETKLNHHKDPIFILTSYLSLLNTMLELGYQMHDFLFENLFEAIRVDNDGIRSILIGIAGKISLDSKNWEKWLYYMRNNNINTSSSVGYLQDFGSKVGDVMVLLSNDRVDASTKASIISSISGFLQKNSLPTKTLAKIIDNLDDYTISEQGDVGNKVRIETIKLIDTNLEVFKTEELSKLMIPKLLRLSCEPIDKTRYESLKLLHKIHNSTIPDFISSDEYFTHLLKFYQLHYIQDKETSKDFWRGYIFTCGAIKATDSLIISSLKCFLRFYQSLDEAMQKEILLQLAAIIKIEPLLLKGNNSKSQRFNKTILVGLQFWSRIFESNIKLPSNFPLKGFHIRIFNLHLNTKNIVRLTNSIKIFGYLAQLGLRESLERLCWLTTKHPIARVRVLASEELFNIYNEKLITLNDDAKSEYVQALKLLSNIDWNQPGNEGYESKIYV